MEERISSRCVFYHRDRRGTVRYLLGRRAPTNKNNVGMLQILGGKLKTELNETPENAFHREASEEAGDTFATFFEGEHHPLGVVDYLHEDGSKRFFHHGFLQRVSEPAEPKPKPRFGGKPPEHDAFFWLTFKQAAKRKLTPGTLDLLKKAETHLAKR
ncbi:NUDIX hydrolase [Candidatus Micrarchaeota archaeon]|nr:NUDIX hydrolase [Candidatus Micrarchaeota archaeon]